MAAVSDPVGQGLISSYSHPGGNITGTASQFEDLMAKMLGQFREAVPQVASMAVVHNPRNPVHKSFLADLEAAARRTSVTLTPFTISRPDDVAPAFDGIRRGGMGAVLVLPDDPVLFNMRRLIVEQLTAHGLPSYFGIREAVEEGGFMSYGESLRHSYFRTAYYLDQIAKGCTEGSTRSASSRPSPTPLRPTRQSGGRPARWPAARDRRTQDGGAERMRE